MKKLVNVKSLIEYANYQLMREDLSEDAKQGVSIMAEVYHNREKNV